MKDLENVIIYMDDLLVHSKTSEEHLILMDHVFTQVKQHFLKVN